VFISIWDPTSNFKKELYFGTGKLRKSKKINGLLQSKALQKQFASNIDPFWVDDLHLIDESENLEYIHQNFGIKIIVPFLHNDKLIGIIGLGERIGEKSLDREESKLIAAFINTISPLIANSFLFIELQHSEKNYRSLVENISDGIITTDINGKILFANESSCKIFGYTKSELIGINIRNFISEENKSKTIRETQKIKSKELSKYELALKRKDGQICQIFVSATPLLDNNGSVYGTIGIFTDISNIKKAEKEKQELREKLSRAKHMESLGVLAGGVAHDLNNILGPLVAYPELIRMKIVEDSPIMKDILKIEKSALRASEVVQDLLALARRGRYEMVPLNFNDIIESYMESPSFLKLKSKHNNIVIKTELNKALKNIHGSESHLYKVIMNLIINAMEAMSQGGQLTVKTEHKYLEKLNSGFNNIEAGEYVIVIVSDTGLGIEQNDLEHIFEPFYSRKEMGKSGSGLGLAIVYGVTKDHNGYIDVLSKVNHGTDFIIYLPVTDITTTEDNKVIVDIHGSEKILVVDDIQEQRELAATILASLGYDVETVADGHAAVKYLKNKSVDVVILDMIMEEGFDGLDTYIEIIKIHPEQKAIIASGFAETDRVKKAETLGVGIYIRKPYTMQHLGKAIRKVLVNKEASTEELNINS